MHVRFPRAAVDVAPPVSSHPGVNQNRSGTSKPRSAPTLWATRPLTVSQGRLLGVRLRDGVVYVALASTERDGLRWIKATSILTEAQVAAWRRGSRFAP